MRSAGCRAATQAGKVKSKRYRWSAKKATSARRHPLRAAAFRLATLFAGRHPVIGEPFRVVPRPAQAIDSLVLVDPGRGGDARDGNATLTSLPASASTFSGAVLSSGTGLAPQSASFASSLSAPSKAGLHL